MSAITLIFVHSRHENSRGYAELKIAQLADKKFMTFANVDATCCSSRPVIATQPGWPPFSVTESVDANNAILALHQRQLRCRKTL